MITSYLFTPLALSRIPRAVYSSNSVCLGTITLPAGPIQTSCFPPFRRRTYPSRPSSRTTTLFFIDGSDLQHERECVDGHVMREDLDQRVEVRAQRPVDCGTPRLVFSPRRKRQCCKRSNTSHRFGLEKSSCQQVGESRSLRLLRSSRFSLSFQSRTHEPRRQGQTALRSGLLQRPLLLARNAHQNHPVLLELLVHHGQIYNRIGAASTSTVCESA